MSDQGWLWEGNHGVWAGGVPAAEARGRGCPSPEAKRRRLGLQAPGGRHPLHIQYLNNALFLQYYFSWMHPLSCHQQDSVSKNKGWLVIDTDSDIGLCLSTIMAHLSLFLFLGQHTFPQQYMLHSICKLYMSASWTACLFNVKCCCFTSFLSWVGPLSVLLRWMGVSMKCDVNVTMPFTAYLLATYYHIYVLLFSPVVAKLDWITKKGSIANLLSVFLKYM